jgi:hypothetical protein
MALIAGTWQLIGLAFIAILLAGLMPWLGLYLTRLIKELL